MLLTEERIRGYEECRKVGGTAAAAAAYVLGEEWCCTEAKLFIICNLAGTQDTQM